MVQGFRVRVTGFGVQGLRWLGFESWSLLSRFLV